MHVDFNPRPPRPPVRLPPGASVKSTDLPPGIVGYSLQDRFLRHYNRPGGNATDSVELDGRWLTELQADRNFPPTRDRIIARMRARATTLIDRLQCDWRATFTDAGYELMPTVPYSAMSWAVGRYSLYWKASGSVGPRRCDVPVAECDGGRGSTAAVSYSIDWTVYDVFDFDWRIIFPWIAPFWFGAPFHVFAEWSTLHSAEATTCKPAPPTPPPCQDGTPLSTFYDVLTGAYREGGTRPEISAEAAIDSAMGRLLQDGKEWCGIGRCSDGTCQPRFSNVTARVGETQEEAEADGLIRLKTRVRVTATISCTCGGPLDQTFPRPN